MAESYSSMQKRSLMAVSNHWTGLWTGSLDWILKKDVRLTCKSACVVKTQGHTDIAEQEKRCARVTINLNKAINYATKLKVERWKLKVNCTTLCIHKWAMQYQLRIRLQITRCNPSGRSLIFRCQRDWSQCFSASEIVRRLGSASGLACGSGSASG